jgi:hypothetical protein
LPRFGLSSAVDGEHVIQDDGRKRTLAQHFLGVQDLDAHQLFAGADVQTHFVSQPQRAALVFALQQANIERVHFAVIADAHLRPPSEIKRVNRYDHYLILLFHHHRDNLFDRVTLPFNPASKQDDRRGSQSYAALGRGEPRTPKTGAALRLLCAKRFGVRQLAAAFSPTSLLAVLL